MPVTRVCTNRRSTTVIGRDNNPPIDPNPPVLKDQILLGYRTDVQFYRDNYGAVSTQDAPRAIPDPVPNAYTLIRDHVGKHPSYFQWGTQVVWPPTAFPTAVEGYMRSVGVFGQYDWACTRQGIDLLLAKNQAAMDEIKTKMAIPMKNTEFPILFRPFWENTGNWYAWGRKFENDGVTQSASPGGGLTPSQYINLWRTLWQIFADVISGNGVAGSNTGTHTGNVTFMWCPNNFFTGGNTPDPTPYYPGVSYVDLKGFDAYAGASSNTYSSPATIMNPVYNALAALPGNQLIAIGEMGVGQNIASPFKEGFFDDFLKPTTGWLATHPLVRLVNYFSNSGTNNSGDELELGRAAAPNAPLQKWSSQITQARFLANVANDTNFPRGGKIPDPRKI